MSFKWNKGLFGRYKDVKKLVNWAPLKARKEREWCENCELDGSEGQCELAIPSSLIIRSNQLHFTHHFVSFSVPKYNNLDWILSLFLPITSRLSSVTNLREKWNNEAIKIVKNLTESQWTSCLGIALFVL